MTHMSRESRPSHKCHIYRWHSLINVISMNESRDVMWHDSLINTIATSRDMTWLIHVTWRDSFMWRDVTHSCHTWMSQVIYELVTSHINETCHTWMSHVTYGWVTSRMNASRHIWMIHVTYEQIINNTRAHYRVAKMHRMPYLDRSSSAKEPYNQWLFCEKWPAT